jgi:hypothetical protein
MSQLRTNSIVPVGGIPAGASGGGIIQVVRASYATQTSSASASWVTIFSASITPRSSSSKILVNPVCTWHSSSNGGYLRVARGGNIIEGSSSGQASQGVCHAGTLYGNGEFMTYSTTQSSWMVIDSPATTSSITYDVQMYAASGCTVYINRNQYNSNRIYDPAGISFLTLMEVSG